MPSTARPHDDTSTDRLAAALAATFPPEHLNELARYLIVGLDSRDPRTPMLRRLIAAVEAARDGAGREPHAAALDDFARDVLRRCRWARAHNNGHVLPAWSTGEQLAVALVLGDREHLESMGYTPAEAAGRVAGGMWNPPADMDAWVAAIRNALTA